MKNFFKNTGIALGFLLAFVYIQSWSSGRFMLGNLLGGYLHDGAQADFGVLYENLILYLYDMIDVVQLLSYVAMLLIFGAFAYLTNSRQPARALGFARPRYASMLWAPVLLGLFLFNITDAAFALIPEDFSLMQEYIEQSAALSYGKYYILEILVTVIGAPFIEEILFRGIIYSHFKKAMPLWVALLAQAVLFGLVHGQILWFVFTFALAIVMGLMVDYFQSLWPAIIVHLLFNASNYLPIYFELDTQGILIYLLISVAVVGATLAALYLYRHHKEKRLPAQ